MTRRYAIPVISERLGEQDLEEDSEEVRHLLVKLLITLCRTCGSALKLYIDDYVRVLCQTVVDPCVHRPLRPPTILLF